MLWVRSYEKCESIHGQMPLLPPLKANSRSGQLALFSLPQFKLDWWYGELSDGAGEQWEAFCKPSRWGFGTSEGANLSGICLPHWFPVVVFSVLTAAPWLHKRYSLRTLLLITTLVAVAFGAIVYA